MEIAAAAERQTVAAVEEIAVETAAAGKEIAVEQEFVVIEQIVAAAEIAGDSVAVQDLRKVLWKKLQKKTFILDLTLKMLLGVF